MFSQSEKSLKTAFLARYRRFWYRVKQSHTHPPTEPKTVSSVPIRNFLFHFLKIFYFLFFLLYFVEKVLFLRRRKKTDMDRQLSKEDVDASMARKKRSDVGKSHRTRVHTFRVGQYDFAGHLEAEYESLRDAAERNDVGGTYQGILACCERRIKKHAGRIWRKEQV